jgi:hypothetical protein
MLRPQTIRSWTVYHGQRLVSMAPIRPIRRKAQQRSTPSRRHPPQLKIHFMRPRSQIYVPSSPKPPGGIVGRRCQRPHVLGSGSSANEISFFFLDQESKLNTRSSDKHSASHRKVISQADTPPNRIHTEMNQLLQDGIHTSILKVLGIFLIQDLCVQ